MTVCEQLLTTNWMSGLVDAVPVGRYDQQKKQDLLPVPGAIFSEIDHQINKISMSTELNWLSIDESWKRVDGKDMQVGKP